MIDPVFRHKKRGTSYVVIASDATLQCSTAPEFEERFRDVTFTVYRNVQTGAFVIRPTPEFEDGRFEMVGG